MLKPGAPVILTGEPLSVWLGPGLIGSIFDGIQRPLPAIQAQSGAWIRRGEKVDPLDLQRRWDFEPLVQPGQELLPGQAIGQVMETPLVRHPILVPPGVAGRVKSVVGAGEYALRDPLAVIETSQGPRELGMLQFWPVRSPRPIRERLRITEPLLTGQRVIDTFFPLGKGGCAAVPGGLRHGQDRHPAPAGQVVRRRHHRLHRMRGARQRDDRSAARVPGAQGSPLRPLPHGAHHPHRQHLQYARGGSGGLHLHRHHPGRVLP